MKKWKTNLSESKGNVMDLETLLTKSEQLDEGLTHFKLSDKIRKLLSLVQAKAFHIPGEDKTKVERTIDLLKEILERVKKIENSYERGNITRRQALAQLRTMKIKALEVKKYLQDKHVLEKTDWRFLISTGLSLIWLPLVFAKADNLIRALFPKGPNAMKVEDEEDLQNKISLNEFVEAKNYLTEEEKKEALVEGVKYFRLSKKIVKLIEKLKDKHFRIPGEGAGQLGKAIKILTKEILPTVKDVEKDYDRGNINWRQASYRLKKLKVKVTEVKKFLEREKIFTPIEWEKYVYVLTSLMWIPAAIVGFKDLHSLFASQPTSGAPTPEPAHSSGE